MTAWLGRLANSLSVSTVPWCAVLSCSVVPDSFRPHGLQPTRLLCPWGFSRPKYWNGYPFPSPGDLPNPGIKPRSPTLQVDSLPAELPGKPSIPLDASLIIQFYLLWLLHVSIIPWCVYSDLACLPSSQICLPELRSLLNSQVCLLWPGVSLIFSKCMYTQLGSLFIFWVVVSDCGYFHDLGCLPYSPSVSSLT